MIKPAIDSATVKWLTEPDAAPLEFGPSLDVSRRAIPMPEDVGDGWVEILNLSPGMIFSRAIHHFKPEWFGQLMPFAKITGESSEPVFVVHSARTGRVVLQEHSVGRELIFGQGMDAFVHVDHPSFTPLLEASEAIEVTLLAVGDSGLSLLLGERHAQSLLAGLGIEASPSARTLRMPQHISTSLYSSLSPQLTGDIRKLYVQAKVLEYLCVLTDHVTGDAEETRISHKSKLMRQLHEELTHLEGKILPLNELATRYGMSARTLNNEFKDVFGQPIHSFMIDHRLNEAHTALQESDIAMKLLAARLGYSHVNHFINAFKKKFDCSPGSLRR